jgi:hypothetical protein
MKAAFLILAHKNPEQVNRLIKSLDHPSASVYVHTDKKSGWPKEITDSSATRIKNNVAVYWGDYTPVEATLNGMKEIIAHQRDFDYFILLSGQDYPIKPIDELLQFLKENKGKEFIEHTPVNDQGWKEAMSRYQYYHYRRNKNFWMWMLFAGVRCFMKLTGFKRTAPMPIYAGSQWFTISRKACEYILDYIERRPDYITFMQRSNFVDEMFFQTILLNAPFKEKCAQNNLRYIDWGHMPGKKTRSPKILLSEDWEKIQVSDAFFARKFDIMKDASILDRIDSALLQRRQPTL